MAGGGTVSNPCIWQYVIYASINGKSLMNLWAGFGDARLIALSSSLNVCQSGTLWKRYGMVNVSSLTSL